VERWAGARVCMYSTEYCTRHSLQRWQGGEGRRQKQRRQCRRRCSAQIERKGGGSAPGEIGGMAPGMARRTSRARHSLCDSRSVTLGPLTPPPQSPRRARHLARRSQARRCSCRSPALPPRVTGAIGPERCSWPGGDSRPVPL
jgi:hypothetical protein